MTTQQETGTQPEEAVSEVSNETGVSEETRLAGGEAQEDLTGVEQGGAEGTDAGTPEKESAERTFSQAEFDKMQGAKDRENADLRRQLTEGAQRQEQERAQAVELNARTVDARAVDEGEITNQEALARQAQRQEHIAEQTNRARLRQTDLEMTESLENKGRLLMALDLVEEFGVDLPTLLNNGSQLSPENFRELARTMGQEVSLGKRETELSAREAALVGTETYDSGQVGATGAGGVKNYLQSLKDGGELPPAVDIDRMTAPYLNNQ